MQASKIIEQNSERYVTVGEFAKRLALAPVTVRSWCAQRRISSVRLGRARRIPESEIARVLAAGYTPALPERHV
jgi:excisionase family DNA binding protein